MNRVQAKLNNSVHCTYGQLFVLNQLITILAEIRSVGLTCERISMILIQELKESQPFYLMKWVILKKDYKTYEEALELLMLAKLSERREKLSLKILQKAV